MRLNTADCSAVVALRFIFTFQSESVLSVLFVVKEERGNKKKNKSTNLKGYCWLVSSFTKLSINDNY